MRYNLFLIPLTLLTIPSYATIKVWLSARRLAKESKKLSVAAKELKSIERTDLPERQGDIRFDLEAATKTRGDYISQRNKTKHDKQRRLVKRLRGLASKESE